MADGLFQPRFPSALKNRQLLCAPLGHGDTNSEETLNSIQAAASSVLAPSLSLGKIATKRSIRFDATPGA